MAKISPIHIYKHRVSFRTFTSLTERYTQVTGHNKNSETSKYIETFKNEILGKTPCCKYLGRHTAVCETQRKAYVRFVSYSIEIL